MSERTLGATEACQRLTRIVNRDDPFETTVERALDLGVSYLGMETGYLVTTDSNNDYWEVVASTDPEDGQFSAGRVRGPAKTYCQRTVNEDTPVAIHDTLAQGRTEDADVDTGGPRCYHGTKLTVNNETYGAVCFVSGSPRDQFTEAETMFAELLARSLEREVQSRQYEVELTRQSNLSNVLNRVLRHNLRNSMAVIRGHTKQVAENAPEVDGTDVIIKHADRLIELGDKARTLESVMVEQFDRREVDLGSMLRRTVRSVQADYPTATITLDCPNDVTVAVRPSLENAVEELVENAAEHGEPDVTVSVSTAVVRNGIRIRIEDDGPGLADIERKALTEGIETPLSHGTGLGLWLSHWIVNGHDGQVDADVSADGTRLTIWLPRNVSPSAGDAYEETDQQLGRVQDKFRAVFEESTDAMLITDDDGQYLDANRRAAELFGVAESTELLGRSVGEFTPREFDFEATWREFQASDRGRGTFPLVRPDGSRRTVEYSAKTDVVPGQHLIVLRDVTERERRNRELELSETVFQNVQDAVFLLDVVDGTEFRVERINEVYESLTGFSSDELVGKTAHDVVSPDIAERLESRYRKCVERRETIQYSEEIPVEGELRQWQTKVSPVVENGSVVKLVGAMRDVTEQREHERELAKQNQILDSLLSNAPIVLWTADEDGVFTRSRGAGLASLGLEPGEVVGESVFDIYADHEEICDHVRRALDGECLTATVVAGDAVFDSWHQPLREADGEIVGTVGFAYEVSQLDDRKGRTRSGHDDAAER